MRAPGSPGERKHRLFLLHNEKLIDIDFDIFSVSFDLTFNEYPVCGGDDLSLPMILGYIYINGTAGIMKLMTPIAGRLIQPPFEYHPGIIRQRFRLFDIRKSQYGFFPPLQHLKTFISGCQIAIFSYDAERQNTKKKKK